jgi:hypothetical protein
MSEDELKERRKTAIKEIEEAKKYCDYIIDTSDKTIDVVLKQALEIINNEII